VKVGWRNVFRARRSRGAVRDRQEPARVVSRGGSTASAFGAAGSLAAVRSGSTTRRRSCSSAPSSRGARRGPRSSAYVSDAVDPGHAGSSAPQQGLDRRRRSVVD
jgi:hypothetical protein